MIRKSLNNEIMVGLILCVFFCFYPGLLDAHEHEILDKRIPVCLKEYPKDPSLFNSIVGPHAERIIDTHGLEEWNAVLLTNELHRHLGMWSIIGAKMGIRAREVLGAPFDQLDVVSFCGYKPPFSCTNDGIQVSTGASLGRGTITNTHLGQPEALFIYNGKRLFLKVKSHVKAEIGKVIKELSEKYGFQSPAYFLELNKIAVKYWLEWNRDTIFEEISF